MACNGIQDYSGSDLLALTWGKPIGIFGKQDIDSDQTTLGDDSQMGIARLHFTAWTGSSGCNIDTVGMDSDSDECKALTQAVKWYAIWRYARASEAISPCKGEDCDGVSKLLQFAKEEACAAAAIVSSCLNAKLITEMEKDCTLESSTLVNEAFFAVDLITPDCSDVSTYPTS